MANRLELVWVGKDKPISVEPRILLEKTELGYRKDAPLSLLSENEPAFDNILIHGDNLLALKALEARYTGKVKCIYIDPPYNTGNAFSTYDDNLEHSLWLNLMKPRLEMLWSLLSNEGSIWISIDQAEEAYLKVLCDEVFGRSSYVTTMIWQKRTSPDMRAVISDGHEYILLYVKDKAIFKKIRHKLPLTQEQAAAYSNPDNDPRGPWTSTDYTAQGYRPNQMYEILTPGGKRIAPPAGRCWKNVEEVFLQYVKDNRIWFGADGCSVPRRKTFLSENDGIIPWTWWTNKEVGHSQEGKKESIALFGPEKAFATPKPERLIQRILTIATDPGDIVLDSFLGSGTTSAVAQKMGRRWIGIEMTDAAFTHVKVRMDAVISGADRGGITKAVDYQGGGGYRFYELAPTLLNEDEFGQTIINPAYNADMLAAAIAVHEGYSYDPDPDCYWKQAHNGSGGYLFTTTKHVGADFVSALQSGLAEGEFLVIVCKSYDESAKHIAKNITIKKIPQSLLQNCEFGHDHYDLNIVCPPKYEDEEEE